MKRTIAAVISTLGILAAVAAGAAGQPDQRPPAPEAAENAKRGEIIINILADGSIRVEGRIIDLEELGERLAASAKQFENQPVRIRGDGAVPYKRIVEVIDTCQRAGIWHISFASRPAAAAAGPAKQPDDRPPVHEVEVPDENAPKKAKLREIIINILADGSLQVGDGIIIGEEDLGERLAASARQVANQPVRIRGDGAVPYQRLVEIIGICLDADIWNISFTTLRPAAAE